MGALKLKDSSFQNVNLVQEVTEKQQLLADELKEDLSNQLKNTISYAMMMIHNDNPPPSMLDTITSQGNAIPSINSVASTITLDTLITTIQDLKKDITTLKGSRNNTINKEINPRTGKP